MIVCITGTPGTGKTHLSSLLGKNVIHLNDFSRENGCTKGYDKKRKSRIVDIDCLKNKLRGINDVIIEGHYSHFLNCDIVIVLRTSPKILRKRLEERNYSKEKIRENLEAEAIGLITSEALEKCKNVYEIDTSVIDEKILEKIEKILKGEGEEFRAGKINYMEEILEWY